jgi:hypothetical protein
MQAVGLAEQGQQQPNALLVLTAMQICVEAVDKIGFYLPRAEIAAAPLQQLQQQRAALLPLLEQIPMQQPEDPQAPLLLLRTAQGLQSSGALQQVVRFAGAVAGQVPLRWGCNHPGCINLGQRSELLLVAGKSCVCGACRAAR